MAFADDFKDMAADTATWKPFVDRDRFGAPTYGDAVTFDHVRLVRKHKLVRNAQGDEVVSTAQLWIIESPAPAVGPEDEITLSNGTTPPIIAVDCPQDEEGEAYTKVYF